LEKKVNPKAVIQKYTYVDGHQNKTRYGCQGKTYGIVVQYGGFIIGIADFKEHKAREEYPRRSTPEGDKSFKKTIGEKFLKEVPLLPSK
jgi:hypothetical protein